MTQATIEKPKKKVLSDQELKDLCMKVRRVVEQELEPLQDEIEKTHTFPQEFFDISVKYGLNRVSLPEEYGGMGLNAEQSFAVQEEIYRGPGGMRMNLHHANCMNWRIVYDHAQPHIKDKFLPYLKDFTHYINFALTEPDCGSGADIRTSAVKKGDKWVINGKKTLISHTDCATATVVLAVTDESKRKKGGMTAFLVETDRPGFRIEPMPHMMGARGAGHGYLFFEDCEVEEDHILGNVGDGLDIFMDALAISRAQIGLSCLALAQRFLELAIARAKDRVTFGKPIIKRQAIQQMIGDMGTKVHGLRLMLQDCARQFDRGEDIEMKSAMAKLMGIDVVREVSDACLEIFGGIGYFEDNPYGPVERLYRDARALWFEEGPRTVQRLTAARQLIQTGGVIE